MTLYQLKTNTAFDQEVFDATIGPMGVPPYIPKDLPIELTSPPYQGQEIFDFTTQLATKGWISQATYTYGAAQAYWVSLYQKAVGLPVQDGTLDIYTWCAAWNS